MILHHVQTSVSQSSGLKLALRYFAPGDTLLLSGDAVNCVLNKEWQLKLTMPIMLLEEDVLARGLEPLLATLPVNSTLIDYTRWVELSLQCEKVITW